MLQAIMQGKAGRVEIEGKAPESWRDVFKKREDLLTAAFWTRIGYLSAESRFLFIREFLGLSESELGEYRQVNFWPRYSLNMKNVDQSSVEPDVILEFEKADILIEVKPPEGGWQYHQQWQREITAYHQDERRKEQLFFIALGNTPKSLGKFNDNLIKKYRDNTKVIQREWHNAKIALLSLQNVGIHEQHIVRDCLSALSLYGIRVAMPEYKNLSQLITSLPLHDGTENIFSSFYHSK
ncbi:hypothetical protein LET06_03240 [Pectobacterium versatile]|uniref:hypothetical protein n=1 Tax=Pectobacterium versatile TaxID=2488639 RepID=UPI001938D89C|nr:hypothetical protein [Pectobacterium versatile]GKX38805.1 hypothetical protein SOASR014_25440 [Pectobacterium carotovorum subsp. carotovorum]MCA5929979.1 hypothetical protein [Pectobacterium versatile]MCA5947175.1 hypothetical protein [Pectobacterium versatile]MCA5951537.1 hypothetical protein [Pectobacterium versatile]QQK71491.1 hypothetical protein HG702_08060 [Pectobacterium versatile]